MGSRSIRVPDSTYHGLKVMAAVQGVQLGQLITRLLHDEQERVKLAELMRSVPMLVREED